MKVKMRVKKMKKLIFVVVLLSFFFAANNINNPNVPVTGTSTINEPAQMDTFSGYSLLYGVQPDKLSISQFVESVSDGQASSIRGVYATDLFALQVVQQPAGNAGYVSPTEGVATQFSMASNYGSIGFLAHNYAAGSDFFDLTFGNIIQVVYGDGHIELYKVTYIYRYQALSPYSSNSQFEDTYTGTRYSASDVFYQMYSGEHHLTLQTCIQQGDIDAWGRLFVIAYPL